MGTLYQQILTILTTPPGNLTYHLVLAFAAAGALQSALSSWHQNDFPQGKRLVIGLALLLGARATLFLGAGLVWQGITLPQILLPSLDRAITMLGIIIIVWLWCFPEPLRTADAASLLLGFITIILLIFNYVWGIAQTPGTPYNATWFNTVWEMAALFTLLLGVILALIRRPNSWGYGLAMLGVMAGGHIIHIVLPSAGSDFAGIVRLAQMAAYPLLFALPQRFAPALSHVVPPSPPETSSTAPSPSATSPQPMSQLIHKRRQHNVEPHILESIFSISPDLPKDDLYRIITRLGSQIMLADLCLLISSPDDLGQMNILCGYDLIREESLTGISVSSSKLPLLTTTLRRGQALRLPASSTSKDFLNLSKLLRLGRAGHLLAAPITFPEEDENHGLILLSPYSNRSWSKEDQKYILNLTKSIQNTLAKEGGNPELRTQLANTQKILEATQRELEETKTHAQTLHSEISILETQSEQTKGLAQKLEKLQAAQEKARETIANLEVEKIELEKQLKELENNKLKRSHSLSEQQLEQELTLALKEIARLKNILANADQKVEKSKATLALSEAQSKSVSMLAQELRQPLSSMVGYTEILLGESVGILGALQTQFLERIRASTERIRLLLNSVIEDAAIDIETLSLSPSIVGLSKAIDHAINEISDQIREKQISMRVDLPSKALKLHIDEDSLHQILINLLKHASNVTRPEGEIFIGARAYDELYEQKFVLIQVTDQGGGIPISELPSVFSQLYDDHKDKKNEEKEVGLSIVKILVEAQLGRVWVDSEEGVGATFSLLLPLVADEMDLK